MLTERDKTFDWTIPTSTMRGRTIKDDLKVNFKYYDLRLSYKFIKAINANIDIKNVRVAFMGLNNKEERAFLVINPNPGIPFYKFAAYVKDGSVNPSVSKQCKQLSDLFKAKFKLNDLVVASFKLTPFQAFNGMMFYSIELIG